MGLPPSETGKLLFGRPARWPILLAAVALVGMIAAVFYPITGFEFVDLDVHPHVIANPHIRALTAENLQQIFTSPCITSYYPIRTLTYAVDHQLWGLDPGGFKLTNGLIHLANTLLVFWLVLRIFRIEPTARGKSWWEMCTATFAAGIFARESVHHQLGRIRAPTLVLVGEEDRATPPFRARRIAAGIPGAQLEIIPGAGHLCTVEEPAAVNAALDRFLADRE